MPSFNPARIERSANKADERKSRDRDSGQPRSTLATTPARTSARSSKSSFSTAEKPNGTSLSTPVLQSRTHDGVPQPGSSSEWRLSPNTHLRAVKCSCSAPKDGRDSAMMLLGDQLARFDKVWRRLTSTQLPKRDVGLAAKRVLHRLRDAGYEMLHIAGRETFSDGQRTELSLLFLVPAPDEVIGHRWVAEVLVHRFAHGKHKGKVENVAVRYATDWQDWTILMPHQYYKGEAEEPPVRFSIPTEGETTGQQVVDEVWARAATLLGRDDAKWRAEFADRISRATAELNRDGQIVIGFSVAKRFRLSQSGKNMTPCVMVPLYTREAADELGGAQDGDEGQDLEPVSGAIVLIDAMGADGRTKPMAVMYDGEWPVAHQYRKRFPPPNLEGLNAFVKR